MSMQLTRIRNFLQLESTSGIFLVVAAIGALLLANSSYAQFYQTLFHAPFDIRVGSIVIEKPLLFWINEGLMTLFFLVVGLELKREFLQGALSRMANVMLPGVAALGGMLVPALIYTYFNFSNPDALRGWSIPVATDIAFALGVLSLFGKKIPLSLKLFLMALAIFDDLGAIVILAVFYVQQLSYYFLFLSVGCLVVLFLLNQFQVGRVWFYGLVGLILWICVLHSGVHATIAGVLLALMMPLKTKKASPLIQCEKFLHPWVAYLILPLFAFANAGFSLTGMTLSSLTHPVSLGIILGLFFGKQLGVMSFAGAMIRAGLVALPEKATWLEFYGVAILCGIGFTMSFFLGTLSFVASQPAYLSSMQLGVLTASLMSAVVGSLFLGAAIVKKKLFCIFHKL